MATAVPPETVRVVLVEDDARLRACLAATLDSEPDFELVASVGSVAEGQAALRAHAPQVLITDLGLPDGSGCALIRYALASQRQCDVMVITVFGDEAHVIEALEAGAAGYVHKDTPAAELPAQIRQMRAGGSPISPVIARQLLLRFGLRPGAVDSRSAAAKARPLVDVAAAVPLSQREQQTLEAIAKGFTYDEIAGLLGVAATTVNTYVRRIYQKLQVGSKTEAVYEARKLGLLDD